MFSSIHSFAPLLPKFLAGVGFLAGVALYLSYTHAIKKAPHPEANVSVIARHFFRLRTLPISGANSPIQLMPTPTKTCVMAA